MSAFESGVWNGIERDEIILSLAHNLCVAFHLTFGEGAGRNADFGTVTYKGIENAPSSWRFPKTFWFANSMELCERAAYYGFFILITLYLSSVVGFTDIEAGVISGLFSGALYLLFKFIFV